VKEISATQLKALLDDGDKPILLDVREAWECGICSIDGTIVIPMNDIPSRQNELDKETPIVTICHHGMRSQNVAFFLEQNGFNHITNLVGGIDAWARTIDSDMATY
jgi:rhodanese-related sulfurtransferase